MTTFVVKQSTFVVDSEFDTFVFKLYTPLSIRQRNMDSNFVGKLTTNVYKLTPYCCRTDTVSVLN